MLAILAESALRSLILGSVVWVGLNLLRVRNPHVQMTCWVIVLIASLAMPLLMHWTTVTITVDALPVAAPKHLASARPSLDSMLPELPPSAAAPQPGLPAEPRGAHHFAINWGAVATIVYISVTALLLLRLAIGLALTWRLARRARPMREEWAQESWAANADVRVSDVIGGPVTVGSTILLPPQCAEWDAP